MVQPVERLPVQESDWIDLPSSRKLVMFANEAPFLSVFLTWLMTLSFGYVTRLSAVSLRTFSTNHLSQSTQGRPIEHIVPNFVAT
jgi:hypothetical protein